MNIEQLKGTGVALVTPFNTDLSIDFEGLKKMLNHISEGNVDYIVVLGTTGEAPTISWSEKIKILEFILEENRQKLPVVLGLGGYNTADLVEKLNLVKEYHLSGILSSSPYYSKPSQKGLVAHYRTLADHSSFPVLLYNVPARTGSNVAAETTIELSAHPNIVGIKEASGDLVQCSRILAGTEDDFLMISGDDALTLPILSLGGHGVISVVANLLPGPFTQLVNAALDGDFRIAAGLHLKLLPVFDLLAREGNPVSLKAGLKAAGLTDATVRLPLYPPSSELESLFEEVLSLGFED